MRDIGYPLAKAGRGGNGAAQARGSGVFRHAGEVCAGVILAAALAACQREPEGPAEQAGKQIDQAVQSVGQEVQKAGKAIEEAAEEGRKK